MNKLEKKPDMITVQRSLAGALIRHLQLPVGVFGAALIKIPEDMAYIASVVQGWNSLKPEDRLSRTLLETLAAPTLVADLRVMLGQTSLIRVSALAGGIEPHAPWLLAGYHEDKDEFQVSQLEGREELLNTLYAWIEADAGIFVPEMKFEVSTAEYAVLLAIVDLYSRAHYSAFITHTVVADEFTVADIVKSYQEAVNIPDPRWLLSFCAPLLPDEASALQAEQVKQCLAGLTGKGLLQAAPSNALSFTVPGLFLAESFHRRNCLVGLSVAGADETGMIGSHAGLFIRSDDPLWYCDIGSDNKVTVLGVDMNLVRQILEDLLTPLAVPPLESKLKTPQTVLLQPGPGTPPLPPSKLSAAVACVKCGFIIVKDDAFCGKCGEPVKKVIAPPPPLPPQTKVCSRCNKPLALNAKFCEGCGTPVEKAVAPPPPPLPPQFKVCSHCNKKLGPNAKFCAGCGNPV